MKKNIKNEKGVTLITLIVTIIILYLIAGVSVKIVLGENGIITQANKRKNDIENTIIDTENDIDNIEEDKPEIDVSIELSAEKTQTEKPIIVNATVTYNTSVINDIRWVLNTQTETVGIHKASYPETLTQNEFTMQINETNKYYLHVLAIANDGRKKEIIKGPIIIKTNRNTEETIEGYIVEMP